MLATIVTQPLIVAKVGLQSKPPAARNGKPFKSFTEVMQYIIEHEGPVALFKGMGPQILKGLMVQGFLMMTKERCVPLIPSFEHFANISCRIELSFILLFRYFRQIRAQKLQKLADVAANHAAKAAPILIK